MFKFLNLQPEVFGIDINDLSLKIIKLKKKRKGFALVSFNEAAIKPGIVQDGIIQDEAILADIIKDACLKVQGEKLNTKYVAVSLPEEKSFSQVIQMPRMTEGELASAVPLEAENYIPLAIDKVYLDFEAITPSSGTQSHLDLLINVMPKSIVDSYVSCFKKAGLIPSILEVEGAAIARALFKNNNEDSSVIFLNLGQDNATFSIYADHAIRFTSSIPFASQQLTVSIAQHLNINSDKAEKLKIKYGITKSKEHDIAAAMQPVLRELATQIKKYIGFYHSHAANGHLSSDGKIEKIILCGGGANLKKLPEFLSKELKITVEVGNPLINIQEKGAKKFPYPEVLSFTTAIGLALRGIGEAP